MPKPPKISRSRLRGYHAEVELVDGVRKLGGEALRVAGSGHKTKVDVLASIPCGGTKRLLAFEVKATEKDTVRIPSDKVRALREFCRGFKQGESEPEPAVAVKWIGHRGAWTFRRLSGNAGLTLRSSGKGRLPEGISSLAAQIKDLNL